MLDAYRQRFTDYCTQSQRESYLFVTGHKAQDESRYWEAEFSDLFTAPAVADLRAAYDDTHPDRVNARAAIAKLWQFAEIGRSHFLTRELTADLTAYENDATFAFKDERLTRAQAEQRAYHEPQPRQRRELALRLADLVRGGESLRAERVRKLHDSAIKASYSHHADLLGQRRGVAYEQLAAQFTLLLLLTERDCRNALAAWLPAAAGVRLEDADECDVEYARCHHRHDQFFTLSRGREILQTLFAGWGFALHQQTNVTLETTATLRAAANAECFLLRVPDEVKLCLSLAARDSGFVFAEFLRAAGATQHAAWTSREQPYEFRVPGDPAVALAWGYLFDGLLQDNGFLVGHFGFADNAEFRQQRATAALYEARRDAAWWLYEYDLYADKFSDTRAGAASHSFSQSLTEALLVRVSDAEHLRAVAEPLRSGDRLRARAFAAQLSEHLKSRYGSRWWAARLAGDMLIDLWNTGHRYTVEELAAQIGLGPLSYDWLASSCLADLANS